MNLAVEYCASNGSKEGLVDISVPLGAVTLIFAVPAPVIAIQPMPGMTISSDDFFHPSPNTYDDRKLEPGISHQSVTGKLTSTSVDSNGPISSMRVQDSGGEMSLPI